MPQKMTTRYSRIRPCTPAGTCRKRMIKSVPAKARIFSTAATAAMSTKDVNTASFRPCSSRWPKRMENTAPLPMQRPSRMDVRTVISVNEEPTAASASGPRKRPTISVSATL